MSWVCPDPSYCCGVQSQPWRRASTCFLNLRVNRPCKGEKERGASNIGNICNKNTHNIPPIIIPLPPVSLTFSTASEPLNSSYSIVPRRLHCQNRNIVAAPPLPQRKLPLPKSDTTASAVLWPLKIENPVFFLLKKLTSPMGNTWEALQCSRWHQNAPEYASRPFKVLTLVRAKMIDVMLLYVDTYCGK